MLDYVPGSSMDSVMHGFFHAKSTHGGASTDSFKHPACTISHRCSLGGVASRGNTQIPSRGNDINGSSSDNDEQELPVQSNEGDGGGDDCKTGVCQNRDGLSHCRR